MPVCDVCNAPLEFADGYALTTRQVAGTEAYWTLMLERHSFDDNLLALFVHQQAAQSGGWLVCARCSTHFTFDAQQAREYARRQADPPGSGPIPVRDAGAPAAWAWWLKYGRLPSWARCAPGRCPTRVVSSAAGASARGARAGHKVRLSSR